VQTLTFAAILGRPVRALPRREECYEEETTVSDPPLTRREALRSAAALPLAAAASPSVGDDNEPQGPYQPESFWQDRMRSPDDGKRYGWFVDTRRCFGCHACEVSCKAENDVPLGHFIRQTFYKDVGRYPKVARVFLPMSCQHCEDAPCIKACPCGALHKTTGGTVAVDYDVCCGNANCVDVCPYGAIYIDPTAKQAVKCHNCYHREQADMAPACVSTCPSQALYFGDLNDPDSPITGAMNSACDDGVELVQLRTEKQTRPRMWFAGPAPAELERDLPSEGESYSGSAYDIYQWKSKPR